MGRSLTVEGDFGADPSSVFDAFLEAVQAHPRTRLRGTDRATGMISGAIPISLTSYGERIEVRVAPAAGGRTHVSVTSSLRFVQMVDWGRNRRNVEQIMADASSRLPQTGSPEAGPPPVPPPPPSSPPDPTG